MKILMFSWEYPPLSYGGLARHVQDLSEALVSQGHQIFVITQGDGKLPREEVVSGVKIYRSNPLQISAINFVEHILHLNFLLLEKAINIIDRLGDFDLIHGHDWLVFWVCRVLKHALTKPLLYTIHATEFGRNQGIYNEIQRYINDLEWYATFEAWRVIVCSNFMKQEVKNLFQLPDDKVLEIANGVNEENYRADYSKAFRQNYASPDEQIILYVGRIVREKGIQVLIQSIPEILQRNPASKFVIAGKGPYLDSLKAQADYLGISNRVYFTGFISDEERNKLYRCADLAVFPSLYEPFGIVALEAMATMTPVIVSAVGGLVEFVEDGENGLTVPPNDSSRLAQAILQLLNEQNTARRLANNGYRLVKEKYSWKQIARKTVKVYQEVLAEYAESDWPKEQKRCRERAGESIIYRYLMQKKYS
ncbi:MAG: glycosyltransferase family 4 protein [Halanaerobiales bacterium]|nr:glycosyltransferase family 4 protein [Halanaerobiales bacterium]